MTPEQEQTANEIIGIMKPAFNQLQGFYDARIILCVLLGMVTGYAAALWRAGVYTEKEIYDLFATGLSDALVPGEAPQVVHIPTGETKQ